MTQSLRQSAPSLIASTLPNPVRAVIFDMDGTLLDTEAAHRRAFAQTGDAIGWPMADDLLLSMVGIHRDENERMLAAHLGPDFPLARFYADSDALFEAAVEAGIPLRPGAQLLLDHLAQAGIPMALATSTAAPYAQQRLEKSGLLHYFDVVVTRSDVDQPKPHPQPYLLAARLLGVDPAHCVAVEDSHAGVRSATAAGIATVMVPDLLPPTEELTLACAQILPSLTDLRDLLLATE
ncbi:MULTISPECIES: HAD family hydrolase [Sphingomonas]|uniref:Haloacid dehalogenase n=1 Tax=Sphingomonas bisphenolicum TaxID=296544 RepID=A0ABN5WAA9_9SPHN|nr:HAD family phosphatase [Sphingomonas bisphenolicum]BBF67912.1 haloacid dehalogenase [Sphingomonas bisphenolicum]